MIRGEGWGGLAVRRVGRRTVGPASWEFVPWTENVVILPSSGGLFLYTEERLPVQSGKRYKSSNAKYKTTNKDSLSTIFIIFFSLYLNSLVYVAPTHQNMLHQPKASQNLLALGFI